MPPNGDAKPELKPFAAFVKKRRIERRLTVIEVAAALALSPVSVYKIEGASRPFIPKDGYGYDEYAKVLGCEPAELKALKPKDTPIAGTVRKMRANSKMANELKQTAADLESVDRAKRESLVATQQLVRLELLEPFTSVAASIDGLEEGLRDIQSSQPLSGALPLDGISMGQWNVVASALGQMAVATGAGAAVGGLAAFGAFAGVAALGTASTGASIASLSGAAATSATLAALGGGSLAAGGWGIVGGTALLAGIAAVPAVAAIGVGAFFADRYAYRKMLEQGAALEDAEEELTRTARQLRVRWKWAEEQQSILNTIRSASGRTMAQLAREVKVAPPAERRQWSDLGLNQERIRFLTLALSTAIEAMSLPTWTPAADDQAAMEDKDLVNARYAAVASVADSLLDNPSN